MGWIAAALFSASITFGHIADSETSAAALQAAVTVVCLFNAFAHFVAKRRERA